MDNKTTKQLLEVKRCSHLILCWIITIALTLTISYSWAIVQHSGESGSGMEGAPLA